MNNFLKNACTLIFSLFVSVSYADTKLPQDSVLCPSLDKLQASAQQLDTAVKKNDYYLAYTASPFFHENDFWWFAGVGNIIAVSKDEAVTLGKEVLRDANVQIDIYANKVGDEYICNYGPGYIQARGKNI